MQSHKENKAIDNLGIINKLVLLKKETETIANVLFGSFKNSSLKIRAQRNWNKNNLRKTNHSTVRWNIKKQH